MVAGLVVGKPLGIAGVTLASVRLRLGRLPRGMTHTQVLGGATLSGIGFTVSLLIVELGIDSPELREQAKVGVLIAAVVALVSGWLVFRVLGPPRLPDVLDPPVTPRETTSAGQSRRR